MAATGSGLPLLHEDVLAWAECSTVHDLEVGHHVILVARVEDGAFVPELGPPLMYYRRSWGVWSPVHGVERASEPVAIGAMEVSARDLRWQGAVPRPLPRVDEASEAVGYSPRA